MNDLIIVNCFKNPEKNIDINLESLNNIHKLKIYNNDDNEINEDENNIIKYYFNCISKENVDSKIEKLILKNINIDFSKSNINFKSLKLLSLKDSKIFFSSNNNPYEFGNLISIIIKGDLENIKRNLTILKENNILKSINQITLKIIPKSSKVNIFKLLNSLKEFIMDKNINLNIYFKGLLSNIDNNKIEPLSNDIIQKLKKLYIFSLNKINKDFTNLIKEELIDKLTNLEELYLNENFECSLDNKLKLVPIIDNCEDININFNLYNINNLSKICLSICEYNKNKETLILYGEANMAFYNDNNKELLLKLINNNHKGNLISLSLCNFDLENIDYLNDIIKSSINSVKNLYLKNLNINQEFVDIMKSKNFFSCGKISIENIIFNEEEIENNFYDLINKYKLCTSLKLISLEDISKYNDLILNDNLENLSLEEIYEINYGYLKETLNKRNKNLLSLSFKNLDFNEENDKNDFIDIIISNKNNIRKLKLIGENFNFIYKEIQDKKIEFNSLEKLIFHIDKENNDDNEEKNFVLNDEDKIHYLENNKNLLNYKNIEKIDLQVLNLSFKNKKKIYQIFNNLKEIC